MRSVKVHWLVGFKQKQWLSHEFFRNIIHIQTYNWTKYALCESTPSGGLQAEAMAFRRSFSKHYTHSNLQLNKVCALWKYSEWWASSRINSFQKKFLKILYTFKHTIEQIMRSVKVHWLVGFKQKQWLSGETFQNNINIQTYNWTNYALCESTVSGGILSEARAFGRSFLKILYSFKHTIERSMRSVKVHWVVGFKQKQGLPEEVFKNIIHIQTYTWTIFALCESTLTGGLQAEAMAFRRIFSKHYTHSNIHLNKVCALWKYTEWWASSRSNGFQKKFFKTLYTFKLSIEQSMRSVKVQWVVGFNQKQWLSEEIFKNFILIQTYNWTKYALCESPVSGGLQAEARASRRSFSKHYSHSHKQLNKICALWKYTEWWASSRTNGFQKKFFKTLFTFKHTIEQNMRSMEVHWLVGFKQKQWLA